MVEDCDKKRGEFKLSDVYTATTKVSSMGDQERGI
jgi:hypothetical protein